MDDFPWMGVFVCVHMRARVCVTTWFLDRTAVSTVLAVKVIRERPLCARVCVRVHMRVRVYASQRKRGEFWLGHHKHARSRSLVRSDPPGSPRRSVVA